MSTVHSIAYGKLVTGNTLRDKQVFDILYFAQPEMNVQFGKGKHTRLFKLQDLVPPAWIVGKTPYEIAAELKKKQKDIEAEAENAEVLAEDAKDEERRQAVADRKAKKERMLERKRERAMERQADSRQAKHDDEVMLTAHKEMRKQDAHDVEEAFDSAFTQEATAQEVKEAAQKRKVPKKEEIVSAAKDRASATSGSSRGSAASTTTAAAPAPGAPSVKVEGTTAAPTAAPFVPPHTAAPSAGERAASVPKWHDDVETGSPVPTFEADSTLVPSSPAESDASLFTSETSSGAGPATPAPSDAPRYSIWSMFGFGPKKKE